MNLRMIKLVTGEVVLGDKVGDMLDEVTLTRPMTMMLDPMQGGVGMIPYDAIYTQEEQASKTFKYEHIIDHDMKIHETFENAYIEQLSKPPVQDALSEETQEIIA